MIPPEVLARVAASCPCGSPVDLLETAFGEGPMDGHGRVKTITRSFLQSRYFSDPFHGGTGTSFCSAACMLRWHEIFWRPFGEHKRTVAV